MTIQDTTLDSTHQASDEFAFVVGGGPVGREVADRLTVDGETVTFVDRAPSTDPPPSQTVQAVNSFEATALDDAGLGDATTALVLEADDATNLLVAQLARTRFDVDRVLVRLNDPDRASVFERPGIETVDTTAALATAVTEQW
jgi:trk system potassium uptake protein TrkA